MSEINVKMRCGGRTLYDAKVSIELEETVGALKRKLCELDETLDERMVEIVYCGNVMENDSPISEYDVFDGAWVHAFKRILPIEVPNEAVPLTEDEVSRLPGALDAVFYATPMMINTPDVINEIIRTTPGLSEDSVAITLLQRSELLKNFAEHNGMKRVAKKHPALAAGVLKLYAVLVESKATSSPPPNDGNVSLNLASDEDIDSSGEGSSTAARTSSIQGAITTAQLASAIVRVTTQQPQPRRRGASTSTGVTVNDLGSLAPLQTPEQVLLSHNLQTMREMGFNDEAVNLEALQLTTDVETAIDLIISGVFINN